MRVRQGRTGEPLSAWEAAPREYWAAPVADVIGGLESSPSGLTELDAAARLAAHGPNRLMPQRRTGVLHELRRQFTQPTVVILLVATALAMLLGDRVDAVIILAIVVLSGLLGFWQEHHAAVTVTRLLERVQIHVEVRRSGTIASVPPADVVPGDVVVLNAGDIVPCDCRVLAAEALQVDESALTGESYPRHKHAEPAAPAAPMASRHSALLQGSHVVSGKGEAIAVVTGSATELGGMSRALAAAPPPTSFEQGTARFGLLLARVTAGLTAVILAVNVILGRPVIDAVLFSLALAVGVTPQMLPAIVAVSLSTGARRMAGAKVIVRRLDAIEDLGSMDVLCTDKTGTLTEGAITLHGTLDAKGRHSELVGERAAVNAALQTGFTNPVDEAVLAATGTPRPAWRAVDEIPFDFERKMLSVLADGPAGRVLITKGAFAKVISACTRAVTADGERPVGEVRSLVEEQFARLSAAGFRVLALAEAALPGRASVTVADERDLTFLGFLTFGDPLKVGLGRTLADLDGLGIRLCVLSGDNRLAVLHAAAGIGLPDPVVLTGTQVDALGDDELANEARTASAFAELTPAHKERIIEVLRSTGAVVGYLGDGVNDAGSLHLADVGISVDTAVDVAKSAAAMVLLDKDLQVVADGVRLGRQTFANTLKYIRTTISANFGNTVSMAIASAFLPFLPLLPRQILLLNFLSDLPSVTIAADNVDKEDIDQPRRWDMREVTTFMVAFGLLSTVFDLLTFAVLLTVFHADATLFRTGWFVGSTLTEIAVLMVLRTRRPAFRSRPGTGLAATSILVALVTLALPFFPGLAGPLGLTALPLPVLATLVGITALYVVAAEGAKAIHSRRSRSASRVSAAAAAVSSQDRRLKHIAREHGHRHEVSARPRPPRRGA